MLNLQRTADALVGEMAMLFKPVGLSPTGFNVLHILRAAGEYGLPSREIGDRMITRDPDLTRLLDRLEEHGWVSRHRCEKDRRRVYSRITPAGVELLDGFEQPLVIKMKAMLGHMSQEKLQTLTQLLTEARQAVRPGDATCSGSHATCDGQPPRGRRSDQM